MADITELLRAVQSGEATAAEKLFPAVYDELRAIAAAKLANESPGQTLQPTALVHEAWIRLASWIPQASDAAAEDDSGICKSRQHFMAVATRAMRRILVDTARRRKSIAQGGEFQRQAADVEDIPLPGTPDEVLAVNDSLEQLAKVDQDAADVVNYRYFLGMTIPETATAMDISPRAADRLWTYARAWLKSKLEPD